MDFKVFLDSKQTRQDWIQVKNIDEFESLITTNYLEQQVLPDIVSINFNLGFDIVDKNINKSAKTGVDALQWLVQFCVHYTLQLPTIEAHGENPDQNRAIETIARNSKTVYGI